MSNTVKLQGISGQNAGTKTKDLKIGDVIIWNFGYKSEVVEITPSKTGKTITFMLKSFESGRRKISCCRKTTGGRTKKRSRKGYKKPKNNI